MLAEYPAEVVDYVCDPRTGIPRRLKWLPTVAEIAEACDERVSYAETVALVGRMAQAKREIMADENASSASKDDARRWLEQRADMLKRMGL